jgi:hypothetical protein
MEIASIKYFTPLPLPVHGTKSFASGIADRLSFVVPKLQK